MDDGDASIVDTALRETEEEIGLLKDQVDAACVFKMRLFNFSNHITGGGMGLDACTFLKSKRRL